jgi:hypothetical protein
MQWRIVARDRTPSSSRRERKASICWRVIAATRLGAELGQQPGADIDAGVAQRRRRALAVMLGVMQPRGAGLAERRASASTGSSR